MFLYTQTASNIFQQSIQIKQVYDQIETISSFLLQTQRLVLSERDHKEMRDKWN